ncbi:DNA-directed RNA polymerase I subunit RPA2 [Asimina triloba]
MHSPIATVRNAYRKRGDGYTDKAVVMRLLLLAFFIVIQQKESIRRCVREDQSAVTVKLFYLQNGSARLALALVAGIDSNEYYGTLYALIDTSDYEIYSSLTCLHDKDHQKEKGTVGSQLVGERAKIILAEVRNLSLLTHTQCLQYIGEYFQPVMDGLEREAPSVKLFALVDQTTVQDNSDSLQIQEALLPGHVLTIYLKVVYEFISYCVYMLSCRMQEKLEDWLHKCRQLLQDRIEEDEGKFSFESINDIKKIMNKSTPSNIGKAIESLVKNGRLATSSGLDLQQRDSMTIPAERLNFLRFLSHFRSVHRGISSNYDSQGNIKDFLKIRLSILNILVGIGMTTSVPKLERVGPPDVLYVLLDGCVVGSIASGLIENAVAHIRRLKLNPSSRIPDDLEVGYVPFTESGGYPGLYLFTSPSRFVRPVRNISLHSGEHNDIELIGPFEQAYMEIRCPDGGDGGRKGPFATTHEEIQPTAMLSVVANLTPWSDHNQSPRNMYQCQMAKQTMAFSSQAIKFRADNKLYHLQTPQSPIVRTTSYEKYSIDEFPTGTNAIVAVLAYTGYDMEDAMILNKSSVERGMCHGHIYQDLGEVQNIWIEGAAKD